jgi:membrane-bound serine protease (ClpP class)
VMEGAAQSLQGERGVAVTDLRPAGTARIGDQLYDVTTESEYVTSGSAVRVVKVRGNRIVVTSEVPV